MGDGLLENQQYMAESVAEKKHHRHATRQGLDELIENATRRVEVRSNGNTDNATVGEAGAGAFSQNSRIPSGIRTHHAPIESSSVGLAKPPLNAAQMPLAPQAQCYAGMGTSTTEMMMGAEPKAAAVNQNAFGGGAIPGPVSGMYGYAQPNNAGYAQSHNAGYAQPHNAGYAQPNNAFSGAYNYHPHAPAPYSYGGANVPPAYPGPPPPGVVYNPYMNNGVAAYDATGYASRGATVHGNPGVNKYMADHNRSNYPTATPSGDARSAKGLVEQILGKSTTEQPYAASPAPRTPILQDSPGHGASPGNRFQPEKTDSDEDFLNYLEGFQHETEKIKRKVSRGMPTTTSVPPTPSSLLKSRYRRD